MTGISTSTPKPQKDSGSQAWVAFTIIISLTVLGGGCLVVSVVEKSVIGAAFTIVGTIVGVLGNALQAPSGIGSVISSALSKKPVTEVP